MVHLLFFNLIIIATCWGKMTPILFAILANAVAIVEWQVQKHAHAKELETSVKHERLKTTARLRKGERLID